MCNVVQLCLPANDVLLISKWNHSFLLHSITITWKWQNGRYSFKNKLGDQIIKQNNYWSWLSQDILICQCCADQLFASSLTSTRWSACHWQITIFWSSSSNNCYYCPKNVTFQWIFSSIMLFVVSTLNMSGLWSILSHSHMSSVNLQVSLNCYVVFVQLVEMYRVLSCNSG